MNPHLCYRLCCNHQPTPAAEKKLPSPHPPRCCRNLGVSTTPLLLKHTLTGLSVSRVLKPPVESVTSTSFLLTSPLLCGPSVAGCNWHSAVKEIWKCNLGASRLRKITEEKTWGWISMDNNGQCALRIVTTEWLSWQLNYVALDTLFCWHFQQISRLQNSNQINQF